MKKRVLIFVPSLMFSGGAEKVAASLSLNLAKKYDIYIVTLFHYDKIYPYRGKYYSFKEKSFFNGIILRFFNIYRTIKKISPDIIISFMNHTGFWIIPAKYLFKINTPLIININTNPNYHYRRRIYGKYLIRFLYPLKKVNAIVPVSKELKKIFYNKYKIDKNKIIPIYNGIDIIKIKNIAQEEVHDYANVFKDPKLIKFITIGRLSGEKGHKYLIEAYSKVFKEIPNSKLFIIGEGPLRAKLQKQINDLGLKNHAILLGLKNNPYKYISKANILVLSSLHEGLPYVLIEAMICGIPIISTNCETGPKEILEKGKYGILVNIADADDLAKKMIQLAKDDKAREDFSKKSFEHVKIFNIKNFVDNWVKLIEHFLKIT